MHTKKIDQDVLPSLHPDIHLSFPKRSIYFLARLIRANGSRGRNYFGQLSSIMSKLQIPDNEQRTKRKQTVLYRDFGRSKYDIILWRQRCRWGGVMWQSWASLEIGATVRVDNWKYNRIIKQCWQGLININRVDLNCVFVNSDYVSYY